MTEPSGNVAPRGSLAVLQRRSRRGVHAHPDERLVRTRRNKDSVGAGIEIGEWCVRGEGTQFAP
jgi:hypothetical protein